MYEAGRNLLLIARVTQNLCFSFWPSEYCELAQVQGFEIPVIKTILLALKNLALSMVYCIMRLVGGCYQASY